MIDTLNSQEVLSSSINLMELNYDAVAGTAESVTLRMRAGNGVATVNRGTLVFSSGGLFTLESHDGTNPNNTILNLGTAGITAPNNAIAQLMLNGVSDAGGAINAGWSVRWETTDNRTEMQLDTAFTLDIDNGSNSMIIGGGTHGTLSSFSDSIIIGRNANTGGPATLATAVVIGYSASASASSAVVIGSSAGGAQQAVAVGRASNASAQRSVAIGDQTLAQGTSATARTTAIGSSANAAATAAIALGHGTLADLNNTLVIGANDSTYYVDTIVFGAGYKQSTVGQQTATLRTTDNDGGTTSGWHLLLRGGLGRSSGLSGNLTLQTGDGTGTPHVARDRIVIQAGTNPSIRFRTHTSGGTYEFQRKYTAYVQTTNATATTIFTTPDLAEGESMTLRATAVARSSTLSGGFETVAVWRRNSAGSTTQVGADTSLFSISELGGAPLVTTTGATQAVAVQVTGVAATTIDWVVTVETINRGATA